DQHDAAILLEASVEETLTEFISKERELTSQLAVGVGRSKLAEALVQLYGTVRGQGLKLDEVERRTLASHATPEAHQAALADLDRTMSAFIGFGRLSVSAEGKRSYARSNWPALRKLIEAERPSMADYCSVIEGFRSSARPPKNSAVGSIIEQLDAQLWGANKQGPFGVLPQICFDLQAREYAREIVHILRAVEQRYREKKQNLAALDFDDLQLRALELLDQSAVLARATQRYRFFLVDEYQDTNSIQRELTEKLALGIGATKANLFIVGDRKQSIYGFRGADVDVFQQTTKALKEAGGFEQPLHLNFRSQPALINFFNYLFERLFEPDESVVEEELPELGFVGFEPSHEQRPPQDPSPLVELLIDTRGLSEEDFRVRRDSAERDAN
ncbi:MAG: UvrD-helicase domain-containing protein, partial [Pyrinomonadaceae bacterium]